MQAAAVGISSIQRQNGADLQSQNLGSSRVGRLNICMIVECDGPVGARAGLAGLIRGGLIKGRRGKHQPGRRLGLCDALPDVGIKNRKFAINVGGVQRLVELRKGRHRRAALGNLRLGRSDPPMRAAGAYVQDLRRDDGRTLRRS